MPSPMEFFQMGQQGGQAMGGPAPQVGSNLMDMFNKALQMRMLMGQEFMKQGILNQTDPLRIEAQGRLNAGNGTPGTSGVQTGTGTGQSSGPVASGTLGTNVPTKFTNYKGETFENQNADVTKQVAQKALDESNQGVQAAKNVLPVLDRLHDLYYKALGSAGPTSVKPGDVVGARINPLIQKTGLALQGSSNPDWTTYKKELESFSNLIGRGAYGEVGRIPFLQNMQNIQNFPVEATTKEQADQLWRGNYQVIGSHIKNHNDLVDQTIGDNPLLKVDPNKVSKYLPQYTSQVNTGQNVAQSSQPDISSLKAEAMKAIARGADATKVKAKYKNMTGMDL